VLCVICGGRRGDRRWCARSAVGCIIVSLFLCFDIYIYIYHNICIYIQMCIYIYIYIVISLCVCTGAHRFGFIQLYTCIIYVYLYLMHVYISVDSQMFCDWRLCAWLAVACVTCGGRRDRRWRAWLAVVRMIGVVVRDRRWCAWLAVVCIRWNGVRIQSLIWLMYTYIIFYIMIEYGWWYSILLYRII